VNLIGTEIEVEFEIEPENKKVNFFEIEKGIQKELKKFYQPSHIYPKNKSKVWQHFTTSQDGLIAKCNHCFCIVKRKNNTTPLLNHIRRHHK